MRVGVHTNNTFDGFHITDSENINANRFVNCLVRDEPSVSNKHRYGYYDGGDNVKNNPSLDYITTPNFFVTCNSFGHGTAAHKTRATDTNGPMYPLEVVTAIADLDATPSVAQRKKLMTNNTGATTITGFDDGLPGQEIWVFFNDGTIGNPSNTTIDFTATSLKGNAGVDWTPNNGDFMVGFLDHLTWYFAVFAVA